MTGGDVADRESTDHHLTEPVKEGRAHPNRSNSDPRTRNATSGVARPDRPTAELDKAY